MRNKATRRAKGSPTRIALVEDDPVYRAYLSGLLKNTPEVELVHAWESAEALVADRRFLEVDLLFIDLELPGLSGVELTANLQKLPTPPLCVMLTSSSEPEDVFAAMRSGASGYLVKTADPEIFAERLRQIIQDGVSLSPVIAQMLMDEFRHNSVSPAQKKSALRNLTTREREVLSSMAKHGNAKEVGAALGLSHETVRVHMKKIYQKLHVKSKEEALEVLAQQKKD
ncbi:response regulator [Prosthecobacter vanneervenii]|uniref:DNA-binding NarL/FixJ family response regulator n=1 Tax=Prosthecobacter vanneervenii TaxID=48466 RepID=A0A7W7Y8P2_9BACT|nr:response regulator transcription factor [Prosthecobacter vanneervenii]MBB5031540.1 DNA-binding NarL/FixJ family response regulator [Prosthecobacter vanneervenii]